MPAKPQWLLQIPFVLEQLRTMEIPVIDRAVCEGLFGVRKRRAVELMHFFGGYRSGNTVLLDRADLIRRLESLQSDPVVQGERQRKARLSEQLSSLREHHRAASVVIPVSVITSGLPAGVAFVDGCMTLEYTGVEELFAKLYALSQAAASDFATFRAIVEPSDEVRR